jgi:hypothetical protein
MTGTDGLVALVAEVWAIAGDRALLHDGESFIELRVPPGDALRFRRARGASRSIVAVGRWKFETTPRGPKRLLVGAQRHEIAERAPRLARAIAHDAGILPDDPFGPSAMSARPTLCAVPRRAGWALDSEERSLAAILAGAVALGLAIGVALVTTLM